MSRIKITLEGQVEKVGVDCPYRVNREVIVQQDDENSRQLKFDVGGNEVFIKKEDLKTLVHVFRI